jgi:hypothetical protein
MPLVGSRLMFTNRIPSSSTILPILPTCSTFLDDWQIFTHCLFWRQPLIGNFLLQFSWNVLMITSEVHYSLKNIDPQCSFSGHVNKEFEWSVGIITM